MNTILIIGAARGGSMGLFLFFFLIWLSFYYYQSWDRYKKLQQDGGTEKVYLKYWKPKIILLIAGLIGLFLPLLRSLIEQNNTSIIGSGGFEKSFEVYSREASRYLISFFLVPLLISLITVFVKKEFPTRVFVNLVMIFTAFFSFVVILISFRHR